MAAATMTSGRPEPVNLDVLYNLFQESAEVEDELAWHGFYTRRSFASDDDVVCALDLLRAAKRPVIFIGYRVTISETGPKLTVLSAQEAGVQGALAPIKLRRARPHGCRG